MLMDCPLTPEGVQQVILMVCGYQPYTLDSSIIHHLSISLGSQATQCRQRVNELQAELVIVSPLRRALQTAMTLFPDATTSPPIVAVEQVREAWGAHLPDKRRTTTAISQEFGSRIDLSNLPPEDVW